MRISVFGMGYVGVVTATCFSELGHDVIGVDVNREKVAMINGGLAPITEPGLQERIATVVRAGRLRATCDARDAVQASNLSLLCVGTPTSETGAVALGALLDVTKEIGAALRAKPAQQHLVVVRSTVPPGTTEQQLVPTLEVALGRPLTGRIEICCNPEFLREGSALRDFYAPPFTVIGCRGEEPPLLLAELHRDIPAPLICTSWVVAEAVKTVSNTFHALKIAFANEIGSLLKARGVDGRQVMDIFCRDQKLNVSPAYLRPGFAFGGSCLPKDTRALVGLGQRGEVRLPLLEHVLTSNETHIDRGFRMIAEGGRRRIAFFGIAFKPGTDDLRESPLVALAERLIGRGYRLQIFDSSVEVSRLTGKNRDFIEREIPHLGALMMSSPEATLKDAEVIVIGHADPEQIAAIAAGHESRPIIDLHGVSDPAIIGSPGYQGICW